MNVAGWVDCLITRDHSLPWMVSPKARAALYRASVLLAGIRDRHGAILVSGIDTLVPGNLYVMGYNPGGDPNEEKLLGEMTIGRSIAAARTIFHWNDWADGRYGPGDSYSELQTRIRSVFEALGAEPRQTFSTNALFLRAPTADGVQMPWQFWWYHCWPAHQIFLGVVKPRLIVCLGNGRLSPWEMLRWTRRRDDTRFEPTWEPSREDEAAEEGKWQPKVTFALRGGTRHTCAVLGLPHPSRRVRTGWPLTPDAMAKIALGRAAAVGWEM